MFTGIIQDQGEILEMEETNKGKILQIKSKMAPENFSLGNSIAVDGVCLTVEKFENGVFQATAIPETLEKSTFSHFNVGSKVNLEAPLTMQTPLAGHFVSGHVDAIAEVLVPAPELELEVPDGYMKFFPQKGSITINGVSLTIARITDHSVTVALIPETLRSTNLGALQPGDHVNIEIDVLARYLDQLQK